ncbi:MAG TPA: rod-binding protein [Candidatus Acidoferrum sp.]|jgi:Rod binding domain-containing protein
MTLAPVSLTLNPMAIAASSHSGTATKASSFADTPAGKKLSKAAGEFESMLLSNLWKSMKSTFASSDDDSDDPAHDTFDEMGIQAMSSAVGKAGGLGLGKLILKHLEPILDKSHIGKASADSKAFPTAADTSIAGQKSKSN